MGRELPPDSFNGFGDDPEPKSSQVSSSEVSGSTQMNNAVKRRMRWFLNAWPPFLGAGIRVKRLQSDWKEIDVEMHLRFWNSNYVGTHYGGSLYSMTDPFYMVMLIENLGHDYVVWDKSATIRFRRPGRGTVTASFRLSEEQIEEIRRTLRTEEKVEPSFLVEIKDRDGAVVAEVQKVLHVRKRKTTKLQGFVA